MKTSTIVTSKIANLITAIFFGSNFDIKLPVSFARVLHKIGFHQRKTRIQQGDWLTKRRTFSPTNHVAEFLLSLRVARTNSPSGKPAYSCKSDLSDTAFTLNVLLYVFIMLFQLSIVCK